MEQTHARRRHAVIDILVRWPHSSRGKEWPSKKQGAQGRDPGCPERKKTLELANDGLGKSETRTTKLRESPSPNLKKSENRALDAELASLSSASSVLALRSSPPPPSLFLTVRRLQHRSIQSSPCIAVIPQELAHTVCCDASPTLRLRLLLFARLSQLTGPLKSCSSSSR
jgi:hypothetical protein